MTEKTPDDYDTDDGWNDQQGSEQCPHCESVWSFNGGMEGPAYRSDGTSYDFYSQADVGNGPFFCEDCWPDLEANRKRAENQSLGDFA